MPHDAVDLKLGGNEQQAHDPDWRSAYPMKIGEEMRKNLPFVRLLAAVRMMPATPKPISRPLGEQVATRR